jgi:hypothetical protein
MKTKPTAYLCYCHNCDTKFIDNNPAESAKKKPVTGKVKELIQIKEGQEIFTGCPNCLTDANLMDI